jgi:hypothetical protein
MRIRLIVSLAALVALALAVPALAGGGGTYKGTIDQTTARPLSFTVKDGKVRKLHVKASYVCADDSDSGVYKRDYSGLNAKLHDGKFSYDKSDTELNYLRFKGRIKQAGDHYNAKGKISIQFRSKHAFEEPDCALKDRDDKGNVAWHASFKP